MTGNRCKARRGGSVKQIQRHLHDRYSDICTSAVFGRGRGFGVILASRILLKNKHLKGKEKERNKKKLLKNQLHLSSLLILFPFQSAHPSLVTLL